MQMFYCFNYGSTLRIVKVRNRFFKLLELCAS